MAVIAPLKGVRYNPDLVGKIDDVVTPPYDVINENSVDLFISKTPYSMIRLDITKNPGPSEGGDSRYIEAAALFQQWRKEGILIRDNEDSLYLYEVEYLHPPSGKRRVRKGLVCLVGLAEFSERIVKPHERTFDTVIEDRLKLTTYCQAQFSQVFSLFSDQENTVIGLLEQGHGRSVGTVTDADGCVHSLRQVTDPEIIGKIQHFFLDKSLYIADGHHRYTTALAYRKRMQALTGGLSENSPANHIMMYLCPMEDSGLSVLPTHRLLNWPGKMGVDELTRRLGRGFDLEEIKDGSREVVIGEVLARMAEIEQMSPERTTTFGVYHPGEDRCFLLKMKPEAIVDIAEREDCLRELDVVILSDLIIEKYFDLDHHRCEQENLVRYFSDPDEALDMAVKTCTADDETMPLLFLMNPTRVQQVKNVADQDRIMPHKSTYFYPKVMTGLLFNQLIQEEVIHRLD